MLLELGVGRGCGLAVCVALANCSSRRLIVLFIDSSEAEARLVRDKELFELDASDLDA